MKREIAYRTMLAQREWGSGKRGALTPTDTPRRVPYPSTRGIEKAGWGTLIVLSHKTGAGLGTPGDVKKCQKTPKMHYLIPV